MGFNKLAKHGHMPVLSYATTLAAKNSQILVSDAFHTFWQPVRSCLMAFVHMYAIAAYVCHDVTRGHHSSLIPDVRH